MATVRMGEDTILMINRVLQDLCFTLNSARSRLWQGPETLDWHGLANVSEIVLRQILVIWGLASVGIATLSLMSIESVGFPDGYISPYDRLTLLPQTVLSAILLLAGLVVLVRGAFNRTGRLDVILALGMLACLCLPMTVIESCPRWRMCTSVFESVTGTMMNDGQGG